MILSSLLDLFTHSSFLKVWDKTCLVGGRKGDKSSKYICISFDVNILRFDLREEGIDSGIEGRELKVIASFELFVQCRSESHKCERVKDKIKHDVRRERIVEERGMSFKEDIIFHPAVVGLLMVALL